MIKINIKDYLFLSIFLLLIHCTPCKDTPNLQCSIKIFNSGIIQGEPTDLVFFIYTEEPSTSCLGRNLSTSIAILTVIKNQKDTIFNKEYSIKLIEGDSLIISETLEFDYEKYIVDFKVDLYNNIEESDELDNQCSFTIN